MNLIHTARYKYASYPIGLEYMDSFDVLIKEAGMWDTITGVPAGIGNFAGSAIGNNGWLYDTGQSVGDNLRGYGNSLVGSGGFLWDSDLGAEGNFAGYGRIIGSTVGGLGGGALGSLVAPGLGTVAGGAAGAVGGGMLGGGLGSGLGRVIDWGLGIQKAPEYQNQSIWSHFAPSAWDLFGAIPAGGVVMKGLATGGKAALGQIGKNVGKQTMRQAFGRGFRKGSFQGAKQLMAPYGLSPTRWSPKQTFSQNMSRGLSNMRAGVPKILNQPWQGVREQWLTPGMLAMGGGLGALAKGVESYANHLGGGNNTPNMADPFGGSATRGYTNILDRNNRAGMRSNEYAVGRPARTFDNRI